MRSERFKTWAGRVSKTGPCSGWADGQFDALLTVDQGIEYQHNLGPEHQRHCDDGSEQRR